MVRDYTRYRSFHVTVTGEVSQEILVVDFFLLPVGKSTVTPIQDHDLFRPFGDELSTKLSPNLGWLEPFWLMPESWALFGGSNDTLTIHHLFEGNRLYDASNLVRLPSQRNASHWENFTKSIQIPSSPGPGKAAIPRNANWWQLVVSPHQVENKSFFKKVSWWMSWCKSLVFFKLTWPLLLAESLWGWWVWCLAHHLYTKKTPCS